MKNTRLLSTVAGTVLLSAGVAFAQAPAKDKDSGASPAPAAQQNAPAEKSAPNMKAGQPNAETHKGSSTTGQAPASERSSQHKADSTKDKSSGTTGQAPASDSSTQKKSSGTTGQAPAGQSGSTQNKMQQNAPASSGQNAPSSSGMQNAPTNAQPNSSQSTTTEQRSTTGQGAAGAGAANLSTEQRTQITSVIKQQNVERIEPSRLNVSLSVGTRIPTSVKFHPLPREVVTIYPQWRGYDYILVGDRIVVLDPRSHEIVAILDA
jgi:hypothetical protein